MKLKGKSILLISPEPWNHIHVSKHHYATHLATRGNQVVFLNPPGNDWKVRVIADGLKVMDYPGFWKGQRLMPAFLRKKNQQGVFNRIQEFVGKTFDMVWSFDNSVFFQMDSFPASVISISHIVDLNMNYQRALAAKTAKVCFCTTSYIKKELDLYNEQVFLINHGYNISEKTRGYQQCRQSKGNIAVGYAGNLDIKYLDWGLIQSVVKGHPKVDFYFAGSLRSNQVKAYFDQFSNMHYVGMLPSNHIQSFYEEMDMLIITYLADTNKEQLANPHKVLEYLYSGKPIVSTLTEHYLDKDLLYMSNQNGEWPALFRHVIENLEQFSSKELADKRKNYALDNTYDKQIDRIEKILASLPS